MLKGEDDTVSILNDTFLLSGDKYKVVWEGFLTRPTFSGGGGGD